MRYRLLDPSEVIQEGDEVFCGDLTSWCSAVVSAWCPAVVSIGRAASTEKLVRRLDDGKGEWLLMDPEFIAVPRKDKVVGDQVLEFEAWYPVHCEMKVGTSIIRRKREVEKLSTGLWVVLQTADNKDGWLVNHCRKYYSSQEAACADAKRLAREGGDGAEFSVAHVDRTFRCEMRVVEKEVGQ